MLHDPSLHIIIIHIRDFGFSCKRTKIKTNQSLKLLKTKYWLSIRKHGNVWTDKYK